MWFSWGLCLGSHKAMTEVLVVCILIWRLNLVNVCCQVYLTQIVGKIHFSVAD